MNFPAESGLVNFSLPELYEDKQFHEFIKNSSTTPKIYFDAADWIEIICGLSALMEWDRSNMSKTINFEKFNSLDYIVYGMVLQGYLGKVYILDPHYFEFISIRKKRKTLFPPKEKEKNDQLLLAFYFQLEREFEALQFYNADKKKVEEIVEKITTNYKELFKMCFLTYKTSWQERFKYLAMDEEILVFPEIKKDFNDRTTKTKLYTAIKDELDKIRTTRTTNNKIDALAFTLFQNQINIYNQGNTNQLPIFYCTQSDLLDVIKGLSKREDLDFPFTTKKSSASNSKERFLLVRDANFFILHGTYLSKNINKPFEDFLPEFRQSLDKFRFRSDLEISANENVGIDFLDRWWRKKGREQLLEYFLANKRSKNIDEELNDQVIEFIVSEEEKREKNFQRLKFSQEIWENLINFPEEIRQRYSPVQLNNLDVEREFGTRYAYRKDVCERITLRLHHYAKIFALSVITSQRDADIEILEFVDVITDGVFDDPTGQTVGEGIAILFLLEKYDLIIYIVEKAITIIGSDKKQNEKKIDYPIKLIFAVSLIHSLKQKRGQITRKTEYILDDILGENISYSSKIGVALVYFYLWKKDEPFIKFPEKFSLDRREKRLSKKHFSFLRKSMDLLKEVIDWLKIVVEDNSDQEKWVWRNKKYFYALNLYLFSCHFGASAKQFNEMDDIAEELENVHGSDLFWQNRFSDTLARYYQRKAFLSKSEKEYKINLETAYAWTNEAILKAKDKSSDNEYGIFIKEITKQLNIQTLYQIRKKYQLE